MMYLLVRGEEISEVGARVPDGIYLAILPDKSDPREFEPDAQAFRTANIAGK